MEKIRKNKGFIFFFSFTILFILLISYIEKDKNVKTKASNIDIIEYEYQMSPDIVFPLYAGKIKRNQFIFDLLLRLKCDPNLIEVFLKAKAKDYSLNNVRVGDSIFIFKSIKNSLYKIVIKHNKFDQVIFKLINDSTAIVYPVQPELKLVSKCITGVIKSTLYEAIIDQGESPELAYLLSDIFSWQIDFWLDIQKNDKFFCVIDKYVTNDGSLYKYGDIKFAYIKNMNKDFFAVGYKLPNSEELRYFDLNGKSLEKSFLKSPLKYTRISSKFSYHRFHPVLKIFRPHLGVDYAAPIGTPVWATASGTVIYAGWKGGGGKTVIIKHAGGYQTSYCHFSRIAKGIRRGVKVRQKQVIGYVGMTGLATGPHTDYRIKKNGYYINPLTLKPPSLSNIPDSLMDNFKKLCNSFLDKYGDYLK